MKKFVYKAWNDKFQVIKSEIEENNIDIAMSRLKGRGLKIIYIKEKYDFLKNFRKKLSNKELANFCGQTALILSSGVSLIKGLEIMEKQTKNKNMKKILLNISEGIRKGDSLAESMRSSGQFPKLLTDMVTTGEISGNVDTILYSMEDFYKKELNIKNKVKNASMYPMIILVVAFLMMLFFNFVIFPEIKTLLVGMKLSLVTIIVISLMNFFNNYYVYLIVFIIGIVIFIKNIRSFPKIAFLFDKLILKIPVLGQVKIDVITARFTRSMGIFLKAAVPIVTVMENIKFIVDNEFISKKIEKARDQLIKGEKFAESIEQQHIFGPIVTEMIRIGEETGTMDEIMTKLADIYDERVDASIGRLMALVEPMLTLIIGIVVGAVILGMALPMMQLTQSMK